MKKHENTKRNSTSENTANITYRELKAALPSTDGVSVPSEKWLREHDEAVFCSVKFDGSVITVYDNGFYTYEKDGRTTILRVDGFDRMRYSFADGASSTIAESEYAEGAFAIPLVVHGENQMEKNFVKREGYHQEISLENDSEACQEALTIPSFVEQMEARDQSEEERSRLRMAIGKLTAKQREILQLYYFQNKTQEEIATMLQTSRPYVTKVLRRSLELLRKFF